MSLNQLITEAIGRPVLYHFCKVRALEFILSQNEIAPNNFEGVSLTRKYDMRVAQLNERYCRLTLDWNRLKDFYKIRPIMDRGDYGKSHLPRDITKWNEFDRNVVVSYRMWYGSEEEERVDKSIERVNRFLIQIDINPNIDVMDVMDEKQLKRVNNEIIPRFNNDSRYANKQINIVDKWEPVKL